MADSEHLEARGRVSLTCQVQAWHAINNSCVDKWVQERIHALL